MSRLFLFALSLLLAARALTAELVILEAEQFPAKGAAAYRDERASGGRCLGLRLVEKQTAPALEAGLDLPPGDYEAVFWLEVAPVDVLHHLAVHLRAGTESRALRQIQFPPGAGYQPLALRLTHPGGRLALAVSAVGGSGFDGMRQTMSEEEKATLSAETLGAPDLKLNDDGKSGRERRDPTLEGDNALDLLEEDKSIAVFKFYDHRLLLDRVELRPLRVAPVVVAAVSVDKIHYLPAETVQATARLVAVGETRAVTVIAQDITEIDTAREVFRQEATVTRGQPLELAFSYPAEAIEFGHALRVTVRAGDQALHHGEAFYGLSRNVYRIGITGAGGPQDMRQMTAAKAAALMAENKRQYANYFERFAWAPCDYSNLAPETPIFYSGQTQYQGSIAGYQAFIAEAHRVGVKAITYGKSCAGGIAGYDTFQRYPDLFNVTAGGLPAEALNVFFLERMLAGDYNLHAKPIDGGWQHWASLWTNWWDNPRTVTYGAEAVIKGVEMFGWDGIRWDGHFVGRQQPFIDLLNARYPNFVHGYNIAFANPGQKVFLPPAEHVEDYHTVAKNHGLLMDESARDWSHTNFSSGLVRPFYEALAREADYNKRIGGLPLYITFDMASNQDTTFNVLCGLAAGQRYTYLTSPGDFAFGPLPRFLTRYSALVWDDTARLADSAAVVTVQVGQGPAQTAPWYDHTTWLRTLPDGRQQVLVNLLNPLGYPAFCNRVQPPPTPLGQVALTLALPAGASVPRAIHASPDLAAGHEELPVTLADGKATVTVPRLHLWSIVALDLVGAPTPAWPLTTPVETAAAILAEQQAAKAKADAEQRAKAGIAESAKPPPAYLDFANPRNRDLEAEAKLPAPTTPTILRDGVLDVHHARGPYSWLNPVEAAVGIAGGGICRPSWVDLVGFKLRDKGCMSEFPADFEALRRYDVLVLDNIHAFYLGQPNRILAASYVRAGGSLLYFGGYCNLSVGADFNSYLGELLPVTIGKFKDLAVSPTGFPLAVADAAFFGDGVDWSAPPVAFTVDTSPLKPGARVLVTAGGHPAIVAHEYGQGRVITVLINPHGEVAPGTVPYWQWPQWPRLLAACLRHLGADAARKETVTGPVRQVDPAKLQPVELMMTALDMDSRQFTAKLKEAQANVVDTASALALLEAIADNADKIEEPPLLGELLPRLEVYFDASFAPLGGKLIKSGLPFLRAAGYQILGQSGNPEVRTHLAHGLQDAEPGVVRQALIGLAKAGAADSRPALHAHLKRKDAQALLAATALFRLGEDAALETALNAYLARLKQRVHLRCGRRSMEDDLWGGTSFKLTPQQRRILTADYQNLRRIEAEADDDLRRFALALHDLTPDQLAIFACFAAACEQPDLLPLAYAVIGRTPADQLAAIRPLLAEARLPALRDLTRP